MNIFSCAHAEFLPKGFAAKFEQEYVSILKGTSKKGNGSIDYKYPSNIRFETLKPSPVIFVSNGVTTWYYRAPFIEGEKGEVTESPAKESSSSYVKFFDTLNNGLISNSFYEVKNEGKGIHTLSFKDKAAKELGIKEAHITFKKENSKDFSDIAQMDLLFSDGKKSTLRFSELKINPNFDAQKFIFVAPTGTKKTN